MLTRMVSISQPRDPPTSASQSAGITGVSHHARPELSLSEEYQFSRLYRDESKIIGMKEFLQFREAAHIEAQKCESRLASWVANWRYLHHGTRRRARVTSQSTMRCMLEHLDCSR